ncbi:LLM class flavin-dependent oxidoreductase [Streptomyces olivoreticuli]|uniref:LLM class flavin-dependent oxidoreductase n=1 Tax=Streptomyces olivoreticuli TaxID=68246 RepID=UPI001F07DCB0|nr:LLM class flavin-dependent oxidoreductase [Streptomyces olivoreticuli]
MQRLAAHAGLGGPVEDEYGGFGEPIDEVVPAERLDEGLGLLERCWTGERVTRRGGHFHTEDVALPPRPVQHPRPPVWVAGFRPTRRPMRRAAHEDGAVPPFESAKHGRTPPVDEVRDLVAYFRRCRPDDRRAELGPPRL